MHLTTESQQAKTDRIVGENKNLTVMVTSF